MEESKKLSKFISLLGLNTNLSRRTKEISIEILGKKNYEKMKKDFHTAWKNGKNVNGVGNALSDFFNREADRIRKKLKDKYSKPKECHYCGKKFYPTMIETELLKYYQIESSVEEVDFCSACLKSAFWGLYKGNKTRKEMLIELRNLIELLGYIPNYKYFRDVKFIKGLPRNKFNNLIVALIRIAPFSEKERAFNFPEEYLKRRRITYKNKFGSWFKALLLAGVLEGYVRRTTIGTFCLAEDGHFCLSMKEKAIDDWLYKNSLEHEKEPKYPQDKELNPNGHLRGDWKVGEVYVEYFGLTGSKDYDKKSETKKALCSKQNLKLIEINAGDISNLDTKLNILLKNKND